MAISAARRKKHATVVVNGKPKFPIPPGDRKHATAALRLLGRAKGLSAGQKAKVRARARKVLGKTKKK